MLVMISNGTEQLLQMLGHVRLQTSSLFENLVITMKCVSGSCHYETCRMHGVVIPLLVDRHTAFAMTTCLYTCHTRFVIANPVRVKQSTCQRWSRGTRSLAMTSCFSAYETVNAVIAGVYN